MANDPFRALAHPLRRNIVERLSGGSATVAEVSVDFGVSKPTISRHLLSLNPETLAKTSHWIDSQRVRWERLFDVVGDYLQERKEGR
jgi:DNA-binding transcriptional ArsR family regulator